MPSRSIGGIFLVTRPEADSATMQAINGHGAGRLFPVKSPDSSCPDGDMIEDHGMSSGDWGSSDIWWSFYNVVHLKRREP